VALPHTMFEQVTDNPTRRRVLWMAPVGLGVLALIWFRKSFFGGVALPDAQSGEEISIVQFSDDGKNLGLQKSRKVIRTDADWFSRLEPQQYYVTRKHSTDMPYTGTYYRLKDAGLYRCICCANALFDSETKYDSGTGWPSFWAPIAKENLVRVDEPGASLANGIEVLCRKCDAHLGHIFGDGPEPTNLRYCMNESSLKFVARRQA
jgi:peptide-methionine (R)-S-oxide reductase